jgi:hypothetical protein
MENANKISVYLNIDDSIISSFDAILTDQDDNYIVYSAIDSHTECSLTFYPRLRKILLKNGEIYFSFKIREGNYESFSGEYDIDFLYENGTLTVERWD